MKETVYKLLDTFTGGKGLRKTINGFSVKLPTRYINYFPSDYESENFEFLKKYVKPSNIVFDIGAHIGLFAIAAAQLVADTGKVYAFEPSLQTNVLLKHSIAINQLQHIIEPHNEAMGAKTGKINFYESAIQGDNSNSLVNYKQDRRLHTVQVDMFSVDDFVKLNNIPQLAFIKIDVEGAEYDALLGARDTLQRLKPACILAIHPEPIQAKGDSLEKIYEFIKVCGYNIYYNGNIISKEFLCNNSNLVDLHLLPV